MSSFTALGHIESYRPSVGVAGVAVLATLAVGSEIVLPYLRGEKSKVDILGNSAVTYAFAGLTHRNAQFLAPHIEPDLGSVDYIHYTSRDGVEPKVIASRLNERFDEVDSDSIQIVGHSLGLLTAMLTIQECIIRGVNVPHIATVWGLGSPRNYQDIRHWEQYQYLPIFTSIFGGFLTQYAGGVITDVAPNPNRFHRLRQAAVSRFKNRHLLQSPTQWGGQLGLAADSKSRVLDMSLFSDAGVIDADTQIKLAYDRFDPTVKPEQASEQWQRTFEPTKAQVEIVMSESDKHVDLDALPEDFWRTALAFAQKELYFNTQVA